MITRIRINEVDAKRVPEKKVQGFDVRFNIDKTEVVNDEIRVNFAYEANYKGDSGHIKLRGEIISKEDKETTKKIEDDLKEGRLPTDYMQKIVNAVNYYGTTHATVVASVIDIVPPIRMPTLHFKQAEKTESKEKKAK